MKIGDDVWALCDPNTDEILVQSGVRLIYESEKEAKEQFYIMEYHGVNCMICRIRLMAVRVGRIPQSEIDPKLKT